MKLKKTCMSSSGIMGSVSGTQEEDDRVYGGSSRSRGHLHTVGRSCPAMTLGAGQGI